MAKLLVVEDEPAIREIYREFLSPTHTVDFAETGQEGFDKGVEGSYDLIITDLNMPNWNGADAMAALDAVKPNQRFLVVSAFLQDNDYMETLSTVPLVKGMLQKPFQSSELIEAIDKALASPVPRTPEKAAPLPAAEPRIVGPQIRWTEPHAAARKLSPSLVWGFSGVFAVLVAQFSPVVRVPDIALLGIRDVAPSESLLFFLMAAFGIVATLLRSEKLILTTGISVLALLGLSFLSFQMKLSDLRSGGASGFRDSPFSSLESMHNSTLRLSDLAVQSVQLPWGWMAIVIGGLLLIQASRMEANAPRRRLLQF